MVKTQKNWSKVLVAGATLGVAFATSSFAVTAPDLPMAGWATQNGGTTGGAGKTVVTVSNVNDLRKYAEAGNYTIYVKPGTYTVPSKSAIKVGNNVTIYGYQGAVLAQTYTGTTNEDNTIMNVAGKNIIIRNLTFKGAGAVDKDAGDCLHIQGGTNVWIDHVDVYDGEDGNLDVINGANYVTISWTRFHYTSASKEHQFSNLIGNSDSKTSDDGKLKTTLHHNWWDDGVKERMPRVRYGQVHVANNLFSTNSSSTCVRAGKSADLRVENNVFIGVNNPIDLYNGDYKAVYSGGNYTENIKKGSASSGTNKNAFTPPYSMKLTDVSNQTKAYALRDSIKLYAGATLPDPGSTQVTPVSSSSVQQSSSSQAKSSSSVVPASSSSQGTVISGDATLTKHGSGSATQEVAQGAAIVEFYYTIEGATGATVTGLPQGVTGTLKGLDYYISGTVASTAETGAYKFTVTTTGASKNASKSGTITVVAGNGSTGAKSSSSAASSSSEAKSSSSEKLSSSSEVAEPSSSSEKSSGSDISSSSEKSQGIQAVALSRVSLTISGHDLSIMGAIAKPITVFDMQGRLIYRNFATSNQHVVSLPGAGGYLVRIGTESRTVRVR